MSKVKFNVSVPEFPFVGRVNDLICLNDSLKKPPHAVVVSGLGGIGKTQLVCQFIEENEKSYKNVIWIDSKSTESINTAFKTLAKDKLKISVADRDGSEKSQDSIIEQVFSRLTESKTLFVYDNVTVDETETIKLLLKRSSSVKPHVIIISRIQDWGHIINVMTLQTWEIEDAIKYVSQTLKYGNDLIGDKESLVNELQAFPLALKQAIAQINDYRKYNGEFKISDYLRNYDEKEMLDSELFKEDAFTYYENTTFTTWNCTFDAVKRDKCNGGLAFTILNIIAYFASTKIQRDFFSHLTYYKNQYSQMISFRRRNKIYNKKNIRLAFRLLIKYSLIDLNKSDSTLNVHKLVQQVVKLKLQELNSEKQFLRYAVILIAKLIELQKLHILSSHASSVFNCLSKFRKSIDEFQAYNINELSTFLKSSFVKFLVNVELDYFDF